MTATTQIISARIGTNAIEASSTIAAAMLKRDKLTPKSPARCAWSR